MVTPDPLNGFTTHELLVRLFAAVESVREEVVALNTKVTVTTTILEQGRFGERLGQLEADREQRRGERNLARWALGSSGFAIVIALVDRLWPK